MSNPISSGDDERPESQPDCENKPSELPNYAQDTLKEVLGWYGLGEGEETKCGSQPGDLEHLELTDRPLDLTNGHSTQEGGATCSISLSGHRKLIGMRFLFPPLSDEMSLYEKAKIWVARHDFKYFVGLTEKELANIDSLLRPIMPVTPELYKLHMNRSEYCRNVKLKYCIESDAPWAKEFHDKLRKPVSEGGFTGLCQAKIAAAELWRKFSENYRSHQARYPNPKSKYRASYRHHDVDSHGQASQTQNSNEDNEEDGVASQDESKRARIVGEEETVTLRDQIQYQDDVSLSSNSAQADEAMNYDSEGVESGLGESHGSHAEFSCEIKDTKTVNPGKTTSTDEIDHSTLSKEQAAGFAKKNMSAGNCQRDASAQMLMIDIKEEKEIGNVHTGPPLLFQSAGQMYQTTMNNPQICSSVGVKAPFSPSSLVNMYTPPTVGLEHIYKHPKQSEKSTEYKRSERGLSFLFPSLSDHNLSLLDKVKITVIRHKNNYFLGWEEEELKTIDPLIRPKMVVSADIYKEYCHRNAMKYDSNLQFAMESPEQWAKEFRAKLSRPPSEGGFSSLCEVKLEAGRLWREYSGKYRMHNIVKWQMDMNSTTKSTKKHKLEGIECEVKEEPIEKSEPSSSVTSPHSSPAQSLQLGGLAHYSGLNVEPSLNYHTREESHHILTRQMNHKANTRSSQCTSPLAEDGNAPTVPVPTEYSVQQRNSILTAQSLGQCPMSGPRYFVPIPDMDIPSDLQSHVTKQVETSCDKSHVQGHLFTKSEQDHQTGKYTSKGKSRNITSLDVSNCESLFKPLSKYIPVADQVCVWLERHKNNYFFGYPQNRLVLLDEYLRPNTVVTEAVFKRFVPESLVDILDKIQYMMVSTEPAAKVFQDRLHKSAKDGGFATFEESLTEAVVLWTSLKPSTDVYSEKLRSSFRKHNSPFKSEFDDMNNNSPQNRSPLSELSSRQPSPFESSKPVVTQYSDTTAEEKRKKLQKSSYVGTPKGTHEDNKSPFADVPVLRPTSSQDKPDMSPISVLPDCRSSHHQATFFTASQDLMPLAEPSLEVRGADLERRGPKLWECRSYLQSLCEEDTSQSWHSRLAPYMAILRKHLGRDYSPPPMAAHCLVDLVLAALHNKQPLQLE